MRLEDIRAQFKDEFVLLEVTKTTHDDTEIVEGNVLAHSKDRDELMALMLKAPTRDVAIEWCGELDSTLVVVI